MIVVTGASRGLGRAIAERLNSQGVEVLGVSRSRVSASFKFFSADVSSADSVRDLVSSVKKSGKKVQGLINAAGVASMNLALMAPAESVRTVVEVNLLGVMNMCRGFGPLLVRAGGGRIINFSTIAVPLALRGESAYVAAKAGVEAYSRTLARELGDHGINVNCIAPGPVRTDLLRGVSNSQITKIVERQVLRQEFSKDDVADVVELLLDQRSNSLSGEVFHIGGV